MGFNSGLKGLIHFTTISLQLRSLHTHALKYWMPVSRAAHDKSTSDAAAMTYILSTDPQTSQRLPICGVTQSAVLTDNFCVMCYKFQATF
jgi:hypothetical protein